jgi:hypothetical protein
LISVVREAALGNLKEVIESLDEEILVLESEEAHRPSLLLVHPELGLIAIEVGSAKETDSIVRKRLNDKVQRLLNEAPYLDNADVFRVSVLADSNQVVKRIGDHALLFGERQLENFDWALELPIELHRDLDFTRIRSLLDPNLVIEIPKYEGLEDRGYEERHKARIVLDAKQSAIASRTIRDILVVAGGPGTGKTMVLLGRAKWLASQHPEWKILLVVYNNMLSKYLRSIPDMPRSVVIVTLKRFLEVRKAGNLSKLLLDFENPAEAEKTAAETVRRMKIDVDDKDIDALLVDEWQDFRAPYIQYLLSLLRPGRGGAMFAGDDKQAIYTDGYASPFGRRHVETEILTRPYRSTQQILRVAAALDKEYKIQGIDEAPSGEPVTAIYAPHWTLQGEAIALEIRQLLKRGQIVPGDIAVLCTTKRGSNHVANALLEMSIPYRHLTKFWEDQEPGGNEVNVMTVHGAKGHGFPVVFIQGFETLKDRDGTQERDKWRRVGFVGVSRAEDLLYIVYKDVTQFVSTVLDLGKKHRGLVVGRMYPDDFKKLR